MRTVGVTFVTVEGVRISARAAVGSSVLEAAHAHAVPMLGTCGGSLVCATCHVRICGVAVAKVPPPTEDEEDTLDLAFGVKDNSRLGCQIKLAEDMEGLEIALAPTMQSA
jgi:ferredoxin